MNAEESLDALDRNLLRQLEDDSRTSVALLARRLGVARTTVVARIARLERLGVIAGYGVRIGRDFSDTGIVAYVGIVTAPNAWATVERHLGKVLEIESLSSVSGDFDLFATVRAPTPDQLNAVLTRMGAIEGVTRLTTLIRLQQKFRR